jgi:hypothetical protein
MKKILVTLGLISLSSLALAQTPNTAPNNSNSASPVVISHTEEQRVQSNQAEINNREIMKQRAMIMWQRMDANHDGKIDRAEFLALASEQFDRLDRDHKGYLVPDDLKAFALLHHHQNNPTNSNVHPHPHVLENNPATN